MIAGIVGGTPDTHRRFLLSFQRGAPEWPLLEVEHAQTLPAVRWQMMRLDRLDRDERVALADRLEEVLG